MSRFPPFYSPGREGFTDQAMVHLVQCPRTWTHWRDSVVPAVFIHFKGFMERESGQRSPAFRVFAVKENHQPVHLRIPETPGNISTDFWEFADQLAVPGPLGSRVRPMCYLIHPESSAQVLSVDQEDILRLAKDTERALVDFSSCPFWGDPV